MNTFKTEEISMTLIASAGEGKSLAFEALNKAKNHQFEEAEKLMQQAEESVKKAHVEQTKLLVKEANQEKAEINVLLIHAQDHLMTSVLAVDLIREMIEIMKGEKV